ncbi:zinc-binding dehydrogenase [Pseudofrankia sp. DC12]|uniref:zinc-binding dehydrogenase n=1 Tax=Pseudofrankia sp. DC12 TaxID=683315 RepID=UPI0005F7B566|nr:zinc-binding dehydrogenase [Pseudofrankia sp. DC12]
MFGVVVRNGTVTLADDLEVRAPRAHEVSVKVLASGVCRSDLLPIDEPMPEAMVLGHEAAGVVQAVGSDVTGIKTGQMVAVSCQVPCNRCKECARGLFTACSRSFGIGETPFTWRGEPVQSLARVSSLASKITVDAFQVHPIENLDPSAAALIGCAVSTGYGMTHNVTAVRTGESLAVFGVGGIGINSIQTARMVGASRIVAVDINASKESLARQFGADSFVLIHPDDSADAVVATFRAVVGHDVDAIIDCTGQASIIAAAQRVLAPGGRLGLVGIPHAGGTATLDINMTMYRHITVTGALNGASNPFVDIPNIVRLAEQGRFNLSDQVTHRLPLDEIDEAIATLRAGKALRVVIDMPVD